MSHVKTKDASSFKIAHILSGYRNCLFFCDLCALHFFLTTIKLLSDLVNGKLDAIND